LNGRTVPRTILYKADDCIRNDPILLHSKCIYPNTENWLYIGSHNLSKSALGDLNIHSYPNNFEMGIFIPPHIKKNMNILLPFKNIRPYSSLDNPGGCIRN